VDVRACPFCGRESAWGESPGGCSHFVGRVAEIGGAGPGARLYPLPQLAARVREIGGWRIGDVLREAPCNVSEVVLAIANGEHAWWTRGATPVRPPGSDLLTPVDWFLGNPAAIGVIEQRAELALRWLSERAA
jgi:hypothetical protein